MPPHAAADRFALLTRLPSLTSLEEKSRALAEAAYATTACIRTTVVVFTDEHSHYASAPDAGAFTLREGTRGLRRLFLPSLAKFAVAGGFYVAHENARSLSAITDYHAQADLLIVPLQTDDALVGALVFDVAERPPEEGVRELRVFADIAAWMIAHEREVSAAEREAKQSALLAVINERARKSLDRSSILQSVAEDVREAFGAVRCAIFGRDPHSPDLVGVIANAESSAAKTPAPQTVKLADTWLERTFAGSVVGRDEITGDNPRDSFLRTLDIGSSLMVPLIIDGRVENAIALHFAKPHAFDEIDMVMLRSVASHVGLALANVQIYDLERLRRARAESLERVVRMLRDTQTMEEVLLVFAVTVSHEVKLTCAVYEIEGVSAMRRAVRAVESAREGLPENVDLSQLVPLLEREDVVQSSALADRLRGSMFASNEGLLATLRIDGNLWGAVVFSAAPGVYDWNDAERRVYFHMLASHLELALSGALGFERIQQLARALSESNEFKDDLLAMLAHDFKGPLTVILGYCELLLENAPAELQEELQTIYSQTKRLVRLADDAVALAQTQAGGFSLDRAPLDLREVVAESVKAHNRGDERIKLSAPAQPVIVSLDPARFNHVLDNLLMNALKYSQDEIHVRVTQGDSNATIAISDRGIGIPASELGTVFSRFGRASNARRKGISGSGVGLYVSRKIVETHGGSIAVQSTEGEGSTFTVTLPLSARAAAEQPSV
ncbi:MAG TPA: GAF domain-containing sensor histidine kinase [Candidatus Baltobacteraceae bacterium]|nr:GAF domain-containing sensor histidine kinase [Candidatus Baltobacteraceae bacterium]